MAGEGGGVFGSRGLGKLIADKKNKKYTLTHIEHIKSSSGLPFQNIIGEFRKSKKDQFLKGTTSGAYVATLNSGNKDHYIVGYNFVKKDIARNPKISPSKIEPAFSWATGAETLNILASKLIGHGGQSKKMDIFNQTDISCKVFTDPDDLIKSILTELNGNPKVSSNIVTCMEEYFSGNLLEIGCDDVAVNELKQIAKYIGELIFGIAALRGNTKIFSRSPWAGDMSGAQFCVPTSPSFKGVDSVLIGGTGCQYPISSKSAAGAKPSFISNVMTDDKVAADDGSFGFFSEMCNVRRAHPRITGAKFGYLFINKIFGTNYSDDVMMGIYSDLRSGTPTGHAAKEVVALVQNFGRGTSGLSPSEANINQYLPNSVSIFLGREIAGKVMNDRKSVSRIKEIIAGKKFFQVNLDLAKFLKGSVYLKVTESNAPEFKLYAGKASTNDITMSQGFLNYELR
jgi:hypothetical protein|tara:strand:- start:198 stop:1562 length:1365 start_codon:yes stop_codon:yes gene_type:complete